MIKRICDRCNKEIEGNYWTIDIYEKEDNIRRLTMNGAVNNVKQNLDKALNRKKEYCENCIDKIKEVIEKEVLTNEQRR